MLQYGRRTPVRVQREGAGDEEMFTMKVEMGFTKPLARQIKEGVEIETSRNVLMNSKAEWNNARIPRIVIEEGERQNEDEDSGLSKKKEKSRVDKDKRERKMGNPEEKVNNVRRKRQYQEEDTETTELGGNKKRRIEHEKEKLMPERKELGKRKVMTEGERCSEKVVKKPRIETEDLIDEQMSEKESLIVRIRNTKPNDMTLTTLCRKA